MSPLVSEDGVEGGRQDARRGGEDAPPGAGPEGRKGRLGVGPGDGSAGAEVGEGQRVLGPVVEGEDAVAGETWPCVSAFLTFVAVDSAMSPIPVRPLLLTTDGERAAEAAAHERRTARLEKRRK